MKDWNTVIRLVPLGRKSQNSFLSAWALIDPSTFHAQKRNHKQQNKWYPQMFLFAHFETTLNFSRSQFICP